MAQEPSRGGGKRPQNVISDDANSGGGTISIGSYTQKPNQPTKGGRSVSPLRKGTSASGAKSASTSTEVTKDGMTVSGDSIMGLLMLGASRGTQIDVATTGNEAARLADALEARVANRFGEDR